MSEFLKQVEQDFAKDDAKVNGGVFMTYKRFKYKIARSHRSNVKFQVLMEQKLRPYQWAIDRGNFKAIKDVAQDVMQEVYAEAILKDITDLGGKSVGYTPEIGVELFKKLPDLWDEIFQFAQQEQNYSPDAVENDSKN